jgi:AcrR family transcriptional regulator
MSNKAGEVAEPRRRMSTDQRREQLLAIGAVLFAEQAYDDVWIEQVAELAGVSRGLLYHYFPTKRDFFAAVVRVERDRMLQLTNPDPALPTYDRAAAALDAYLGFAESHAHGFRAFHRAAASGDPEIRQIYEEGIAAHQHRILEAFEAEATALEWPWSPEIARLAVHGWMAFVVTVCLEWLDNPGVTRDEVRELCARALFGAVGQDPER